MKVWIERVHPKDPKEGRLWQELLKKVNNRLAAKQMVGAHRQFVHARESIQCLPERALLAGSLLSFLAATVPAVATGFWNRKPQLTPGRSRRHLFIIQ